VFFLYSKNNWSFGNGVSAIFDEHVRNSVPLYDLFQTQIASMSVYFAGNKTNVVDIGTSTGNLIQKIFLNNKNKEINFWGIDVEESMIARSVEKYKDINFKVADALCFNYSNFSVITSMLTLQFMDHKKRISLLNKIHKEMNVGGALFIVEKIRVNNPEIHDIYSDLYYDFKRNYFCDKDILDKNQSLRGIMKPLTLEQNIKMLNDAGFNNVDVFLKINNFIGIIAIK